MRIFRLGILFVIIGLYITCNFQSTPQQHSKLGFNGFPWGTPMDTIASRLKIKPDEKLADRIRYNKKHAIYEGIMGERIAYVAPGNKLISGTFTRFKSPKPAFDSLYKIFVVRCGKPVKNSDGAFVWAVKDTEVTLYMDNTLLMASAIKK